MVYTIVGDNSRELEYDKILKKIRESNPNITEKIFDASQNEQEAFIASAQVNSMFGGKELLILKRAESIKKIADFLGILKIFDLSKKEIIIELEKSGNNFAKKAQETAKGLGQLILVKSATDGGNIRSFLQAELGISNKDAYVLKEMIGDDIQKIKTEIDKIKNFFNGEPFNMEEAKKIISIKEEFNIFEVIDKLLKGNKKNALKYIEEKGNCHLFLYNLAQEFKNLLKIKLLIKKGKLQSTSNYNSFQTGFNASKEYFKNARGYMHPYGVFKKMENIKFFKINQLKDLLRLVHETEYKIKSGYSEEKILVELLIMKI